MAFSNLASDRMDELRFRSSRNGNEASLLGLVSPQRNGNRLPQPLTSQDGRGVLTRRFTTESGRVPTINTIGNSRNGLDGQEYGPSVCFLCARGRVQVQCMQRSLSGRPS